MIRFSRKSSNKIRRLTCRGDCGSNSSENHRAGARRSDAGPTREHRGVSRVHQGTLVLESEDAAGTRKGRDVLRTGDRRRSRLAPAYAGLADCYTALGYGSYRPPNVAFERAKAAASRAIALDPDLADPHASLGYAQRVLHDLQALSSHAYVAPYSVALRLCWARRSRVRKIGLTARWPIGRT